jgi:hypothetical protein
MSLSKFVEYTKHVDHSQKGRRFSGRVMEVDHLSSLPRLYGALLVSYGALLVSTYRWNCSDGST